MALMGASSYKGTTIPGRVQPYVYMGNLMITRQNRLYKRPLIKQRGVVDVVIILMINKKTGAFFDGLNHRFD